MRLYRNMKSRITGVQQQKIHLYKGLDILSRDDFYAWSKNNPSFDFMFEKWKESNFDRRLTPTVDRINSKIGYVLSNMRWLTHSENSRLGGKSRHYPK